MFVGAGGCTGVCAFLLDRAPAWPGIPLGPESVPGLFCEVLLGPKFRSARNPFRAYPAKPRSPRNSAQPGIRSGPVPRSAALPGIPLSPESVPGRSREAPFAKQVRLVWLNPPRNKQKGEGS